MCGGSGMYQTFVLPLSQASIRFKSSCAWAVVRG